MPFSGKYGNPPSIKVIQKFFNAHAKPFADQFGFTKVIIDFGVAEDVVHKYLEDMDRYERYSQIPDPNVFKRMGHLAFWIRKLKPIKMVEPSTLPIAPLVNEAFALLIAFLYCDYAPENPKVSKTTALTDDQWNDLLVYLRYKSVSPHSLMMMLLMMYCTDFKKK